MTSTFTPAVNKFMKKRMYKLTFRFLKSINLLVKWKNNQLDNNKVFDIITWQSTRSINFKSSIFNLRKATRDQVLEFLNSFDTVLTDCDGVLWHRDEPIPGSADMMNHFRKLGKRILYVTNNSTRTRSEYASKAQKLGFIASKEEVICTAFLVGCYLKSIGFSKKVYIMGSNSIGEELNAVGIRHIGTGPDPIKSDFMSMKRSELDTEVGAVIVSFDKDLSYPKLIKVASYLSSEDCLFIATNTDETYPTVQCIVMPAAGTFVRAVEFCIKRKAFVVGKPYEYIRNYLESCDLVPARTLMIGDSCKTDIELGVRCGFQTLLVLSGVTSEKGIEKIRREKTPPLPDVVLPKLGDLMSLISL